MYGLKLLLICLFYGVIGFNLAKNDVTPFKLSFWAILICVMAVQFVSALWR